MKRLLFIGLLLALLCDVAIAQTVKIDWALYEVGGSAPLSRYSSQANCDLGAKATNQPKKFRCDREITTIPVCTAPKPGNDTQPGVCAAGTYVAVPWTQTRSYVVDVYPKCWTAGTWSPSAAPAGACLTIPPKPADSTQTAQCTPPQVGSWPQTATFSWSGTAWTQGPWLPVAPQAGACTTPSTTVSWTFLGFEDDSVALTVPANSTVRYGYANTWIEKQISGSFSCTNAQFGSDPFVGQRKQCELGSGSVTNPPGPPTPTPGTATLSWATPTTNADGTALTDLAGFRIYSRTSPTGAYVAIASINSPSATTYAATDLAAGTYYFVIRAYDVDGNESAPSTEVSKTIQ